MEDLKIELQPDEKDDAVIAADSLDIQLPEVVNTVVNDPKENEPPVITPPKNESPRKRVSKTITFSPEEFDGLETIFNARFKSLLSTDYNHFIRQMIDYAINYEPGDKFARPKGVKVEFKNAFKNPAT